MHPPIRGLIAPSHLGTGTRRIQREMSESTASEVIGLSESAPGGASATGEVASGGAMPSGVAAGGTAPSAPAPARRPGGETPDRPDWPPIDLAALGLSEFADIAALIDPRLLRAYTVDPCRETAYALAESLGGLFGGLLGHWVLCQLRWQPVFLVVGTLFRLIRLFYRAIAYGINSREFKEACDEFVTSNTPLFGIVFGVICDCLPPWLIAPIFLHIGLSGEPDAQAHMQHYLDGSGQPIIEPIERIVREDSGVKRMLEWDLDQKDEPYGELVDALRTEGYKTSNWAHALGNVDLIWYHILGDPASRADNRAAGDGTAAVWLAIRDPYEWHPDAWRRIWCLHSVMENMKMFGARDFLEVGDGVVRLDVPDELVPL